MAEFGGKWRGLKSVLMVLINFLLAFVFVSAERGLTREATSARMDETGDSVSSYVLKAVSFLWQPDQQGYQHVWPEMKFGWQIVLGSIIGFFGAAFGSVGGVGGGGIFVPMLSLIIGFDPKSATAISKCMIMGAAVSSVYYNLKLRHPTIDMPIIDYDLALLIQPMLMLGISLGVALNVIFADWMVTVLLIVLFTVTSTKAFFKGVETWRKETIIKREAAKHLESNGTDAGEVEYKPLRGGPSNSPGKETKELEELSFNWQAVIGTIIGFFGAAFGSVGGVGGGGIFVPMLTLIIGFDPKSATAISKCMIMGAAVSTVYHNLRLRHPTLDLPVIDYDLVLLIQPMLMLGISIGVTFNVIFPDWVITVTLIILCIGTSVKAFFKGLDTWKIETILKEDAAKRFESTGGSEEVEYKPLPDRQGNDPPKASKVTILQNIYWKELGLLVFVWVSYLAVQIAKNYTAPCSTTFWVLNLLQIPVSIGVFLYEAIGLYKGRRRISSKGDEIMDWQVHRLLMFSACGVVAGIVGGLLGIGGGFVMGPLFLEMGIPPQVTSGTATFGMLFSSSMSVVEYYLLDRFPVPYALYFIAVAIIAAFIGQYIITKLITISGRASLIIFVLAFTIFISAIALGGVGITRTIGVIERDEYMGFENLCKDAAA